MRRRNISPMVKDVIAKCDEEKPRIEKKLAVPPSFYARASPLRSSLRKHNRGGSSNDAAANTAQNNNSNSNANGRQKSPGRKTVSFCSDKKVSNVSDCLQIMQNGTELIKLRTNVRQFRRVFSLDADLAYIRWHPTNKKPHKARIAVDCIKEVRVGWNTELLRATENSGLNDIQEVCAFSVIYGSEYECLDLIALTPDDANVWVIGLMALSNGLNSDGGPSGDGGAMAMLRERWLTSVFNEADSEHKGYISEKSTVRLIRSINKHLHMNRIKQKVKETSTAAAAATAPLTLAASNESASRGRIDCNQFIEIYRDVATRPEIYFLMVRYANKDYLSCQDLQLFLETEQGMTGVTREFCENIIDQCEPCPEAKENNYMTVDGFTNYLLSDANSIFDPSHQLVCQDMDQPLNRYFIATSYNTYLVEDQLKGPSSIDGYISALKRNCRFIELDLWEPNAEEEENGVDEPIICHGGTLTSRLALSAALSLIAELAFERSRYPLFIRLEIHLSIKWQKKLVEMLETHFGSKLYHPTTDPTNWTLPQNVPTPKKFIGKIILSGTCYETSNATSIPTADGEDMGEVTEEDEGCDLMTGKARKEHRMDMCSALSQLIAPFLKSKHLRPENDFRIPNNVSPQTHILSMTENDCLRLLHNQSATFGQKFRDYLMRITPNIARVDSSNLNPQDFWNFGLNMVALNYQTPGLMMDLQEGKFAANGACGFVLKPAIMFEEVFTPTEKMPFAPQVLHLKILSAQQLQRPRGSTAKGDSADPFVVIEVFGIPADCAEERTKTVRNDSFNPNFDESFQFEICMPELALVRFLLLDDDFIGDDFIGQYTIPFECLQSGYRHIPLLNNEGDPIENSTLFVHVAITNRRGGGKARKRGMSVKRKATRVQTGIKMIGVKSVDELFKIASQPLIEFIELRTQLESAMVAWQEECGLGPTGSMRQGLRLIHSRVSIAGTGNSPPNTPNSQTTNSSSHDENSSPSFVIFRNEKNQPAVRTFGAMPESIQKSFATLESLLRNCEKNIFALEGLQPNLAATTTKVNEFSSELPNVFTEAGLRTQKSTRAAENFAWNVRLLKTQSTLMQKTLNEVNDIVFQVIDTAKLLNVFDDKAPKTAISPKSSTSSYF